MKLKAGGMPPTELPPLPAEAELDAEYRRFRRGAIKAYAIVLAIVILAIAYFHNHTEKQHEHPCKHHKYQRVIFDAVRFEHG